MTKGPKSPKRWPFPSREEVELVIYSDRTSRFTRALFPASAMGRSRAAPLDEGWGSLCVLSHPWIPITVLLEPTGPAEKVGLGRRTAKRMGLLPARRLTGMARRQRARLWDRGRSRRRRRW